MTDSVFDGLGSGPEHRRVISDAITRERDHVRDWRDTDSQRSGIATGSFAALMGGSDALPDFIPRFSVPLPDPVLELQRSVQCFSRLGLFEGISRAWIAVDNRFLLWNYATRELIAFEDETQVILTAFLVDPVPGVFQSYVHKVIVLVTGTSLRLLGVTFVAKENPHASQCRMFDLGYVLPTLCAITSLAQHTKSKRLFCGAVDGYLYELVYAAKGNAIHAKIRLVNHSIYLGTVPVVSAVGRLLSSVQQTWTAPLERCRQVLLNNYSDDPLLFTLSVKSQIDMWSFGQDINEAGGSLTWCASREHTPATLESVLRSEATRAVSPLVRLFCINGGRGVTTLVAVAANGDRFTYEAHTRGRGGYLWASRPVLHLLSRTPAINGVEHRIVGAAYCSDDVFIANHSPSEANASASDVVSFTSIPNAILPPHDNAKEVTTIARPLASAAAAAAATSASVSSSWLASTRFDALRVEAIAEVPQGHAAGAPSSVLSSSTSASSSSSSGSSGSYGYGSGSSSSVVGSGWGSTPSRAMALSAQVVLAPREFVVLHRHGIAVYAKLRPVDVLHAILLAPMEHCRDALLAKFSQRSFTPLEYGCMLMQIASNHTLWNGFVLDAAAGGSGVGPAAGAALAAAASDGNGDGLVDPSGRASPASRRLTYASPPRGGASGGSGGGVDGDDPATSAAGDAFVLQLASQLLSPVHPDVAALALRLLLQRFRPSCTPVPSPDRSHRIFRVLLSDGVAAVHAFLGRSLSLVWASKVLAGSSALLGGSGGGSDNSSSLLSDAAIEVARASGMVASAEDALNGMHRVLLQLKGDHWSDRHDVSRCCLVRAEGIDFVSREHESQPLHFSPQEDHFNLQYVRLRELNAFAMCALQVLTFVRRVRALEPAVFAALRTDSFVSNMTIGELMSNQDVAVKFARQVAAIDAKAATGGVTSNNTINHNNNVLARNLSGSGQNVRLYATLERECPYLFSATDSIEYHARAHLQRLMSFLTHPTGGGGGGVLGGLGGGGGPLPIGDAERAAFDSVRPHCAALWSNGGLQEVCTTLCELHREGQAVEFLLLASAQCDPTYASLSDCVDAYIAHSGGSAAGAGAGAGAAGHPSDPHGFASFGMGSSTLPLGSESGASLRSGVPDARKLFETKRTIATRLTDILEGVWRDRRRTFDELVGLPFQTVGTLWLVAPDDAVMHYLIFDWLTPPVGRRDDATVANYLSQVLVSCQSQFVETYLRRNSRLGLETAMYLHRRKGDLQGAAAAYMELMGSPLLHVAPDNGERLRYRVDRGLDARRCAEELEDADLAREINRTLATLEAQHMLLEVAARQLQVTPPEMEWNEPTTGRREPVADAMRRHVTAAQEEMLSAAVLFQVAGLYRTSGGAEVQLSVVLLTNETGTDVLCDVLADALVHHASASFEENAARILSRLVQTPSFPLSFAVKVIEAHYFANGTPTNSAQLQGNGAGFVPQADGSCVKLLEQAHFAPDVVVAAYNELLPGSNSAAPQYLPFEGVVPWTYIVHSMAVALSRCFASRNRPTEEFLRSGLAAAQDQVKQLLQHYETPGVQATPGDIAAFEATKVLLRKSNESFSVLQRRGHYHF